jgi:hypothetical protein
VAPRGAEICRRSCRAARLAPGLAHAAHAFHSLWTLNAAFRARAPVQNRAGIVGHVPAKIQLLVPLRAADDLAAQLHRYEAAEGLRCMAAD